MEISTSPYLIFLLTNIVHEMPVLFERGGKKQTYREVTKMVDF